MNRPSYGQEWGSETLCAGSHLARSISDEAVQWLLRDKTCEDTGTLKSSTGYCTGVQTTVSGPDAVRESYLSGL
jgi:hypothetical protein